MNNERFLNTNEPCDKITIDIATKYEDDILQNEMNS